MNYVDIVQMVGLLGLRTRYWLVIIVVVLVILALGYYARGRAV